MNWKQGISIEGTYRVLFYDTREPETLYTGIGSTSGFESDKVDHMRDCWMFQAEGVMYITQKEILLGIPQPDSKPSNGINQPLTSPYH